MKSHDATPGAAGLQPASSPRTPEATTGPHQDQAATRVSPLQATIDSSPRTQAQKRAIDATLGPALQRHAKAIGPESPQAAADTRSANPTGMPDALKAGIESLSGMDMSAVRVHRNSAKPAQLSAHAYAQGQDIHLGPGQDKHLPHEAWHVVQQRQGRVRPTGRVAGQALNDDPGLEQEASAMGSRALQMKLPGPGEPPRQHKSNDASPPKSPQPGAAQASTSGGVLQAWPDEDILIARLRGLDTVLRAHQGVSSELILSELEALTEEIESKHWYKAVAVMVALRDKYHIDQFPPPLIPSDAPDVIGGHHILESSRAIPLPRPLTSDSKPTPGSRRIELGAGDMASAATLGAKDEFTAYTEFRSQVDTHREYEGRLDENLEKFRQTSNKTNAIKFGVDATQEGPYEDLPLTENLRFTNPNLGHDDIKARVRDMILAPVEDEDSDLLYLSSMGIGFWLDGKRLKQYKEKPPKEGWQFPLISSTTNSISSVRNVFMLQKFLTNAPAKLIPGSGKVEIIVSASYLKSWPIQKIAEGMGYKAVVQNPYDLGFENVKTQKSEAVKTEAPAKKCLITLYLPWGEALFKTNSMTWVDQFTSVPTSLLVSVSAPD